MTDPSDYPLSGGVDPVPYPGGVPLSTSGLSPWHEEPPSSSTTTDVAKDQAAQVTTIPSVPASTWRTWPEQAGQVAAEATHQVKALISQTRSELTDDRHPAVRRDRRRSASRRAEQGHLARGVRRLRPTLTRRPRPDAVGDVEHVYTFLFTAELLEANSMPLIGRPEAPKTLPKSDPARAVTELVTVIGADQGSGRRGDWLNVTTRSSSPRCCPVCGPRNSSTATSATSRRIDDDGVLHVRGKGNKDRRIPVAQDLLDLIDDCLRTHSKINARRRCA